MPDRISSTSDLASLAATSVNCTYPSRTWSGNEDPAVQQGVRPGRRRGSDRYRPCRQGGAISRETRQRHRASASSRRRRVPASQVHSCTQNLVEDFNTFTAHVPDSEVLITNDATHVGDRSANITNASTYCTRYCTLDDLAAPPLCSWVLSNHRFPREHKPCISPSADAPFDG